MTAALKVLPGALWTLKLLSIDQCDNIVACHLYVHRGSDNIVEPGRKEFSAEELTNIW